MTTPSMYQLINLLFMPIVNIIQNFDLLSMSKSDNPTIDNFTAALLQLHTTTKLHLQKAQNFYTTFVH